MRKLRPRELSKLLKFTKQGNNRAWTQAQVVLAPGLTLLPLSQVASQEQGCPWGLEHK